MSYKPVQCYYCGRFIEDEYEYVCKPMPYNKKGKTVRKMRDFHKRCLDIYEETSKQSFEKSTEDYMFFDKSYDAIDDFLGYKEIRDSKESELEAKEKMRSNLSYIATRLKGLHIGKFSVNSQNTIGRATGYEYEVIYYTILLASNEIRSALKTVNTKNYNHEINLIFKILLKHIDSMNYNVMNKRVRDAREREIAKGNVSNPNDKVVMLTDEDTDRYVPKKPSDKHQQLIDDLKDIEKEEREGSLDMNDLFN